MQQGQFERIPLTEALQEKYHIPETVKRLTESTKYQEATTRLVEKAFKDLEESGTSVELISRLREALKVTLPENRNLYKFPVSKYDNLNINKRRYPKKLWERVIHDQEDRWKGLSGLADHPSDDSDGEFKNSSIVWLDMEIDPKTNLVWGVGVFVGPYGRLAQEIIDVGGRVGFSSSGFGELGYDGETVDPESYIIERVADLVLNPSQGVYGASDNNLNVEYSSQKPVKENSTNSLETLSRVEEKHRMSEQTKPAISKIEEKKFRRDVESLLNDASKLADPQVRLVELTEILDAFEEGIAPDLREKVETEILAEKLKIETMLRETSETLSAFGATSPDAIKAGVALLAEEVNLVAAEAKDWEKIAIALRDSNKSLKEENQKLSAELSIRPSVDAFGKLTEKVKVLEEQKHKFATKYLQEAEEENETSEEMEKKMESLNNEISGLKSKILEFVSQEKKFASAHAAEITESKKEVESAKKLAEESKLALEEAETTIDLQEQQITRLQNSLKETRVAAQKLEEEYVNFQNQVKLESAPPKIVPRFEERVNGLLNFRENNGVEVEALWQTLTDRHGSAIKPFEKNIRGAKTIREATSAYYRALPEFEENNIALHEAELPDSTSVTRQERVEMFERQGVKFGGKTLIDRVLERKGYQ